MAAPTPYHPGAHAARRPDKPAVIMAGSGEEISYRLLDARSAQVARLLAEAGCGPGDHVALLLETHARYAELCWGAHRSGLHYSPLNPRLTLDELAYLVDDCGARVLVTSARQAEVAAELRARCTGVRHWFMIDDAAPGFASYETEVARQPTTPLPVEPEGAPMLYSSGTTGRPKGIKRPLSGLPVGSTILGLRPDQARGEGMGEHTVGLVSMPLHHSAGLTRTMIYTASGSTVVLMEKFDAEQALALVERYRITHTTWVATMFVRLLRLPEEVRQRYDLSSLQEANVGRGPTPPAVKAGITDWLGPIVSETYGATEANGLTRISAAEARERPGSVGRPVYGELHILRPDGTEAAPGEVGTIYFADGRPFEYHNDPEKTAAAHTDEGWSTVGDVGYVDEDGYLYITDRLADVIISGGLNVYPREIEDTLVLHPAVDDVAVIGVPDEEWGERVTAVVVPRPGAVAGDDLADELIAHCRRSLASYKCPRRIDFRDALPRHETGKLYKRHLRDEYWRGRASPLV